MTTAMTERVGGRRAGSVIVALFGTELRLVTREWGVLVFGFVFPTLFMLVLAGVFAGGPDEVYDGATGTDYYMAAYVGVPTGALAFIGLPVMLATYRERAVLQRLRAFGVPTGRTVLAQTMVIVALAVLGSLVELAVAAPIYGLPPMHDLPGALLGYTLGSATMLSLGVVLGLAVRGARSASALGMGIFMPMWILGGGGPPRGVMTGAMQHISDVLPLWHMTAAIRNPWLGTDDSGHHLLGLAAWLAVGLAGCAALLGREH